MKQYFEWIGGGEPHHHTPNPSWEPKICPDRIFVRIGPSTVLTNGYTYECVFCHNRFEWLDNTVRELSSHELVLKKLSADE